MIHDDVTDKILAAAVTVHKALGTSPLWATGSSES